MPADSRLPISEEPKAIEVLKKLADPALLQVADRYCRIEPLEISVCLVLKEPADHLSPESWRIYPPSIHERVIWNSELMGDLSQVTPQALLRDLYRPVRNDGGEVYRLETVSGQAEADPWNALVPALQIMKREPWPEIRSSVLLVEETNQHRRYYYREPWLPVKSDEETRSAFSFTPFFEEE